MDNEKVMRIVSVIIFLAGIICLGGVVYYLLWGYWADGWEHFYTWLIIIGVPCLIVGTILVNKYLRSY